MPVGILNDGMPAEPGPYCGGDCGCMTVALLPIGLITLRAVMGVVPVVVTDEGVEPEYPQSEPLAVPSLLSDFGAGGARYDLRLALSINPTAHSCKSTGVLFAACTK